MRSNKNEPRYHFYKFEVRDSNGIPSITNLAQALDAEGPIPSGFLARMLSCEKSVGGIPTRRILSLQRCQPKFHLRSPCDKFPYRSVFPPHHATLPIECEKRQFPKNGTNHQSSIKPYGWPPAGRHSQWRAHLLAPHARLLRICEYILFNPFPRAVD